MIRSFYLRAHAPPPPYTSHLTPSTPEEQILHKLQHTCPPETRMQAVLTGLRTQRTRIIDEAVETVVERALCQQLWQGHGVRHAKVVHQRRVARRGPEKRQPTVAEFLRTQQEGGAYRSRKRRDGRVVGTSAGGKRHRVRRGGGIFISTKSVLYVLCRLYSVPGTLYCQH